MSSLICSETDFINQNQKYKDWYWNNYPFLQVNVLSKLFPLSDTGDAIFPNQSVLIKFYQNDSEIRNLPINNDEINCYEFLYSYFLANGISYTNDTERERFYGKTPVNQIISNLPSSVTKTVNDIGKNLGISLNTIMIIIVAVAIIMFINLLRK